MYIVIVTILCIRGSRYSRAIILSSISKMQFTKVERFDYSHKITETIEVATYLHI